MGFGIGAPNRSDQAGFSLLELMVVIAIVSVLSIGAVLTASGKRGPSDLMRFQTQFETQRALAISGRDRRGLNIDTKGIQQTLWRKGAWTTTGAVLRWRRRAVFSGSDTTAYTDPEVTFAADGRTPSFSIAFADGASCVSDGWTGITCSDS